MDTWLDAPALRLYAICSLVLVLKMMATGAYTSYLRIRRRRFATPEDYAFQRLPAQREVDEDIERVRRAHRNDLENILPFFVAGGLYASSEPTTAAAGIGLIGFTGARILHTLFYLRSMQPWRTIAFTVAALLLLWMTVAAGVALL